MLLYFNYQILMIYLNLCIINFNFIIINHLIINNKINFKMILKEFKIPN